MDCKDCKYKFGVLDRVCKSCNKAHQLLLQHRDQLLSCNLQSLKELADNSGIGITESIAEWITEEMPEVFKQVSKNLIGEIQANIRERRDD